jgi:hypothetical protein
MPPPEPLDPLAYWELAGELAGTGGEVRLRAAVGRAYYALFLLARERTGAFPASPQDSAHALVIRAVRKRWGFAAGNSLYLLKELRIAADYQLVTSDPAKLDWEQNWRTAQNLVSRLLPLLQTT